MERVVDAGGARRAAALILGSAALVTALTFGAAAAQAKPAPPVGIAAGSATKIIGQPVTLTVRAGSLPTGAAIVVFGWLPSGRKVYERACSVGVVVCVRRVSADRAVTVRFRAYVLLRGRYYRPSRLVSVTWRPRRPTPPKTPTPPAPPPTPPAPTLKLVGGPTLAEPIDSFCPQTVPGGATGTMTRTVPGNGTSSMVWSLPTEVVAGATATFTVAVTPQPGQAVSGAIRLKAPPEFGASLPAEVSIGGATTSTSDSVTVTFTPIRRFTPGERLTLRLEVYCTALNYLYVAS